jgi:hypothetical protein
MSRIGRRWPRWLASGLGLGLLVGPGLSQAAPAADWRLVVEAHERPLAPRSVWLWLEPPAGRWPAEPVRYRWRCDAGRADAAVVTARASRGCRYEAAGAYRPAVTVLGADGRVLAEVAAPEPVVVRPRPSAEVALTLRPKDAAWRAPLVVAAAAQVRGLLADEPVEEVAWLVDERPVDRGATATLRLAAPGDARVTAVVRTPYRTLTATQAVTVRANQPPVCVIGQTPAETPLSVRLRAHCRDADGDRLVYRWTVAGERREAAETVWTAPKAGRYPVRLVARDARGAETVVEGVIEWGT